MTPPTANLAKAYEFFHDGSIALASMEDAGIRIDVKYLKRTIAKVNKQIAQLESELKSSKLFQLWRKKYGDRTNLTSDTQLGEILFGVLKIKCPLKTATGKFSTTEDTLRKVKHPFCEKYLEMKKHRKTVDTYLTGILRETDENGFLHPNFKLITSGKDDADNKGGALSYRGSCADPNLQNQPIRNKKMSALIRPAFIARNARRAMRNYGRKYRKGKKYGFRLAEIDFKQLEVCINACVTGDSALIRYVTDPSSDMHKDTACDLLMLKSDQVTKELRNIVKNAFVFPQFYGDYYSSCAKAIWPRIKDLKLENGKTVKEHLAGKGIKRLGACNPRNESNYEPQPGTFEYHAKKVEHTFWNERFKETTAYKRQRYAEYKQKGYFDLVTGFRCQGMAYRHNQVINFPTQGPAFHCLLWCITEITKEFKRRKMQSVLVGEIHDCILADIYVPETQLALNIINRVMTKALRKAWKWIIVPLVAEISVSPEGKSWYDKEVWIKDKKGRWKPEKEISHAA